MSKRVPPYERYNSDFEIVSLYFRSQWSSRHKPSHALVDAFCFRGIDFRVAGSRYPKKKSNFEHVQKLIFVVYLFTGDPSKQDLRWTQKPIYSYIFTNNIWSYLLSSSVNRCWPFSSCIIFTKKKKNKDVSREFDEFLVNTHLCKLRCWYS